MDRDTALLALFNALTEAAHTYSGLAVRANSDAFRLLLKYLISERTTLAGALLQEWGPREQGDPFDQAGMDVASERGAEWADLPEFTVVAEMERIELSIAETVEDLPSEVLSQALRQRVLAATGNSRQRLRQYLLTLRELAERMATNLFFNTETVKGGAASTVFQVWFGTNRRPIQIGSAKGFSGERDSVVHYGRCEVLVPETHRVGAARSGWLRRLYRGDDRLRLQRTDPMEETAFWQKVAATLASGSGAGPNDAIVFIHGYNVTFDKAAVAAAQIGADLGLPGIIAFFGWPSRGRTLRYLEDEASIEASEPQITQFLTTFALKSGARAVHIIAHSMGNRGLLRAVDRMARNAAAASAKPFGQIILAAPDVDTDVFAALSPGYSAVCARTTLYVSSADLAVRGSRLVHGASRVGFVPPVVVLPDIDTISVAAIDLTLLGHGYVSGSREVISDMFQLMVNGAPPSKRATLRAALTTSGQPYWTFAA